MLESVTDAGSDFDGQPEGIQRTLILSAAFSGKIVGSLEVTEEGRINRLFSSETQSGGHANRL